MRTASIAISLTTALAGCADESGNTLDGTWTGIAYSSSAEGQPVELTLAQMDKSVAGSGWIVVYNERRALSVEGVLVGNAFALTLTGPSNQTVSFHGPYNAAMSSYLAGTLDGSGFLGDSLALQRE